MTAGPSLVQRLLPRPPRPVYTDVASRLAEIRRLRRDLAAVARAIRLLRRDLERRREAASVDGAEPTEASR